MWYLISINDAMQGKGINRAQTPFLYLSSPEWRHAEWTERMPRGKKRKEEKEVCWSGLSSHLSHLLAITTSMVKPCHTNHLWVIEPRRLRRTTTIFTTTFLFFMWFDPLEIGIRLTIAKMEGGVSGFPGMVLNSHNYTDWKIKMEDLLIIKDLYEPVDREQIPTGVLESEWNLLNRKTFATIWQCVDVSVL